MNANNRFMNYTIANIRVSLPDACTGEHFTRALRPFLTLGAGPADLALEIVPRIPAEADYSDLDIFELPDADADCRFGTDEAGYLIADETTRTSLPGVYAVGDVRRKPVRQILTAAADGAVAAHYIEEYLAGNRA